MTTINVYISCLTDPLVYITLACRRSDLKANPSKMTGLGEMNPAIRGRMLKMAGCASPDPDAAVKATVTSQATYECDNEETGREKTSSGNEEAAAKVKGVEKIHSREGSPEGASFACTEI